MAIITLYDIDEDTLSDWARANCPSFTSWYVYENDIVFFDDDDWNYRYEFDFLDEREAMMFQMRWQGV